MILRKIGTILFAVFFVIDLVAQETSEAIELVRILHGNSIELRQGQFEIMMVSENAKTPNEIKAAQDSLYIKLASSYQALLTDEEIKTTLAFYTSSVGQKLIHNRLDLNTKTLRIINKWEMEQQGIVMEEPILPVFDDNEELVMSTENKALVPDLEKPKKPVFPKIVTLEDLKKIVIENPFMISDPDLLIALLGEKAYDDMHNPQFLQNKIEAEKEKLGDKKQ
jgi:hypothetical protein